MVTYFSCNGRVDLGSNSNFFFKIFICNMLLQLFTTSRIMTATTTAIPFCFQGQLWGRFFSTKNSSTHLTQWFWYHFKLFYCLLNFHMQIIIFTALYWKAWDILWKWYTTVNICLLSYFNSIFYITQQQWTLQKLKPSN